MITKPVMIAVKCGANLNDSTNDVASLLTKCLCIASGALSRNRIASSSWSNVGDVIQDANVRSPNPLVRTPIPKSETSFAPAATTFTPSPATPATSRRALPTAPGNVANCLI